MSQVLRDAVRRQRILLEGVLAHPLERLAQACQEAWSNRDALESLLQTGLQALPSCKYLYVLDRDACQRTANVTPTRLQKEHFGRNRKERPYLADALAGQRFSLSHAYISRNARRP